MMNNNAELLSVERNDLGDQLSVYRKGDMIYAESKGYNSLSHRPVLFFTEIDDRTIRIDDINARTNGIHNGSILLKALIKYATDRGCTTVIGRLSPVDADHKDRLVHFYTKLGFEITKDRILLKI